VTINYRLGALGFLANSALMEASTVATTGFYGVQDQRFALQWVQNNIKAFGGNPSKVTVSGESAGAFSVLVHLAAPRSAGLFAQAIMESGYDDCWTETQAYYYSGIVIQNLNCASNSSSQLLSCLRAATPAEIVKATSLSIINPMLHPYEITDQPINLIKADSYNQVPLLAGTNLDENSLFLCPQYPNGLSASEYLQALINLYGQEKAQKLYEEYPVSNYSDPLQALIAVQSDATFKCATKTVTFYFDFLHPDSPSYLYSFEHVPSFSGPCYGVAHSFELAFLFPYSFSALTSQEWRIATNMRDAWSSFISTGTPSMPLLPSLSWAQTGLDSSYMVLDILPQMKVNFDTNCQYW